MYDCKFGIFDPDIQNKGVLFTTVPMKNEYLEDTFFECDDFPGITFYISSYNETEAAIVSKDLVPLHYRTDKMRSISIEIAG